MKYTLTTPCIECPFLRRPDGTALSFPRHGESIRDGYPFPCHMIANSNDDKGTWQHCAGALIVLMKEQRYTEVIIGALMFRAITGFNPGDLDMDADTITLAEFCGDQNYE